MSRRRFKNDAERQTERRVRYTMRGLTTQGKPRKRHPNFVNRRESGGQVRKALAAAHRRHLETSLRRYHRIAAENRARGLRVDGKPFRRAGAAAKMAREWEAFRSQIVMPVSANWEISDKFL